MTPTPLADPRKPKCSRCRYHGIVIPKKGHAKFCPFLRCVCWKCSLITERTRVTRVQRNLTRVPNTGTAKQGPGSGGAKPAAAETSSARPPGDADPGDTSGPVCPPGETPELPAPVVRSPVDLRSRRPDPGGEPGTGLESRDDPPGASNSERFSELGPAFPLPLHVPFPMSGYCHTSYPPPPHVLLHLPYLPPVPAGLYDGLCGPLMFPPLQQGALQYLPPPETTPPADCRPVFFTHQPPLPPPDSIPGGAAPSDSSGHKH
ncbi:doublesex- and mab-3-related transcription factor B1-like [Melanotaenia boesemani]|uniref:doublesex- and mab-3-related transcription factor B1-like n=1 Tax=Melanotaenia boesemani TaxID=1250792 RepID=UPI001C0523CA|nr:doublesex- and mab-3-related transcription factor B1-like [Melanotaenia boesemani]